MNTRAPNKRQRARRRIGEAEKDRQALELRKAGLTYDQIARQMGYRARNGARMRVERALHKMVKEPAEEVRALELARLDTLLDAVWAAATKGELKAVGAALKIMERRAVLLGLDAPRRQVVNVITEDVVDAEIARLEAELAAYGAHRD